MSPWSLLRSQLDVRWGPAVSVWGHSSHAATLPRFVAAASQRSISYPRPEKEGNDGSIVVPRVSSGPAFLEVSPVRLRELFDRPGQAPVLPLNRGEEASLVVPTTVGAGPYMKRRWVKAQAAKGGTLHLDPEDAAFSYRLSDLD